MLRRRVWSAVFVGSIVMAALAPAAGAAQLPGIPGWRIVLTDHSRSNVLIAVEATSARDAWAAGGIAGGTSVIGRPFAEHWNGRRWRVSALPRGLTGQISFLCATSRRNVWAFGEDDPAGTAFALRWDGRRWAVVKRWTGSAMFMAGAAVFGPKDVWLFSRDRDLVQHYDGRSWHRTSVPGISFFASVSGLSPRNIWALAVPFASTTPVAVNGGLSRTGYIWRIPPFPSLPAGNGNGITGIYARAPGDVWALGGGLRTDSHRHDHWYPLVAHWNGNAWRRVSVTGSFQLASAVSDGHGGLWVRTDWDSTGVPPHLLHFTGGHLARVFLPRVRRRYVSVFDLARIPGSVSVWGAGTLSGLGGLGPATGVILKYGR